MRSASPDRFCNYVLTPNWSSSNAFVHGEIHCQLTLTEVKYKFRLLELEERMHAINQ